MGRSEGWFRGRYPSHRTLVPPPCASIPAAPHPCDPISSPSHQFQPHVDHGARPFGGGHHNTVAPRRPLGRARVVRRVQWGQGAGKPEIGVHGDEGPRSLNGRGEGEDGQVSRGGAARAHPGPDRPPHPHRPIPPHPTAHPPPLDSSHFRRYCGVSKYCSTRASRAAPGPGPGPPPGGLRGSEVGGVEEGGWVG